MNKKLNVGLSEISLKKIKGTKVSRASINSKMNEGTKNGKRRERLQQFLTKVREYGSNGKLLHAA